MTVTVKVEVLKQMEEQIKSLQSQLQSLNQKEQGFERLDCTAYIMEVYNR